MLPLQALMIGSSDPTTLAKFYEKVLGEKPSWHDGNWSGWQMGTLQLTIGEHSEVHAKSHEPQRLILNFEVEDVKGEFARIKKLGAEVIKAPYEMMGGWIATLADPDGNYFQLVTPFEMDQK